VNLGNEIKSVLDPVVSNQLAALQSRMRNDPAIERAAREQWVKMCRSIPLGGCKTGLPPLWLEMRLENPTNEIVDHAYVKRAPRFIG
jgi:hypothetical protein